MTTGLRVLVVDDDPATLEMLTVLLEAGGAGLLIMQGLRVAIVEREQR